MRSVIALVACAALGAVVGAIWLGVKTKEPTVVADPYEEGLHYGEHGHRADAIASATRTTAATSSPTATHCDLDSGPCTQPSPALAGAAVTLSIAPRPLRAMRDLELTVAIAPTSAAEDAEVSVSFSMPGMYMGDTRFPLAPAERGLFRGKGVLVRCPSGRRDWVADVVVRRGAASPRADEPAATVARFPLSLSE